MLDSVCLMPAFSGGDHHLTSFLPANLMGKISIDPTKTSTSTSDANYVTSSDIYDERYLCDTPLAAGSGCSCSAGSSRGLVGESGRVFPGSTLGGAQTAVIGPLGIQGPAGGVPHPSFRFAQKVTDVSVNVRDITLPNQEKEVWDAKFRLMGPDGSAGSDYLPSSLPPIGGETQTFHKLCSALNSFRTYKVKVLAGGEAPIDQTIVLNAKIVQPPELIDPTVAASEQGGAVGGLGGKMTALGPRMYEVGASANDQVGALNGAKASSFASTSSFACAGEKNLFTSRSVLVQPESRTFPALTPTAFNDCCGCAPPKNPPGCHKPPTVTIHMPTRLGLSNFI